MLINSFGFNGILQNSKTDLNILNLNIQGLRGMKRNARCTKEVILSFHKNNVIF
jgi:hypothetical protein